MAAARKKRFELNIGSIGIVILIVGLSTLILASFMLGVMVGRNIESYPEKIARSIPSAIKEQMSKREDSAGVSDEKKEMSLTFYKTLPRSSDESTPSLSADSAGASKTALPEKHEHRDITPPRERAFEQTPPEPGQFTIQVAAFRDMSSVERLRSRLAAMNYTAVVHESSVPDQGTWYRLRIEGFDTREAAQREAGRIERAIGGGLSCLVLKNH